jgi:hypothetical protein
MTSEQAWSKTGGASVEQWTSRGIIGMRKHAGTGVVGGTSMQSVISERVSE